MVTVTNTVTRHVVSTELSVRNVMPLKGPPHRRTDAHLNFRGSKSSRCRGVEVWGFERASSDDAFVT
ncbi:hypothetical protein TNCV_5051681 [Trichonephila clavipes]|nr:hypothetical protein TNCV_5051681 [Trichonephila clavipes]